MEIFLDDIITYI